MHALIGSELSKLMALAMRERATAHRRRTRAPRVSPRHPLPRRVD
jgi:hypothetical protein